MYTDFYLLIQKLFILSLLLTNSYVQRMLGIVEYMYINRTVSANQNIYALE